MLLRNLMEDKQLNLDQPLLSVRRHSPAVTSQTPDNRRIESYSNKYIPKLPTYKSELKSGPIRNPGAVPFIWEDSPGQPRTDPKPQSRSFRKPPVPPGRPKHLDSSRNTAKKQDCDVSCSKDNAEKEGCSDSDDEAYIDALDTLSRSESSFLNCSVSGLSGVEDLNVKSSQDCEFVMVDRFLPAAKAMASDSDSPHASKKQLQTEQPKNLGDRVKPSLRYGPNFANRYANYHENQEEEDERDGEYDQDVYLPSICGLLPRFCLKSSPCKLRSESCQFETPTNATLPNLEHKEAPFGNRCVGIEGFQSNKGMKTFREFLDDRGSLDDSDSEDRILENALSVDTLHKVESPNLKQFLLEEEDSVKKTNEQDFKKLHREKQFSPLIDESTENRAVEKLQSFALKSAEDATEDSENHSGLPAPPPLPKSPSDSWLFRTLPNKTAKNSPLHPFFENQSPKATKSEMKWETIVKTTKIHRRRMHHSEEPLTAIPEA